MPIWKLTPIDTNALQWQVSKYLGEVVVRAESEHRARELVGYCCWQTGQSSNVSVLSHTKCTCQSSPNPSQQGARLALTVSRLTDMRI